MKKLLAIFICVALIGLNAKSQTKKPSKQPAKTVTSKPATTTSKPVSATSATTVSNVQNKATLGATPDYKTAIGLKFLYGLSLTAKHFLKEKHALEGIFTYRGFDGLGTQFGATIVYEYHNPINGVAGLKWYVGGGGHFQYFSFDDDNVEATTQFGAVGVLGLEYKFKGIPLAISADWQPIYLLNENSSFSAENGGIGIKYTF